MSLNWLLWSQLAGYVVAFILSLCITIPMSLNQDEFRGHCLLFSTGEWQEGDGKLVVNWASQAFCNYTIFVGVSLFVAASIQIYRTSRFLYKGTDSSFLAAFFDVIASISLCLMTVISALIVTLGFMRWCEQMTQRFDSCELSAGNPIFKTGGIDTSYFYFEVGIAQFAVWGSWATWVGLAVFSLLKLCRYHQLENIRVSMFRERQKLISEQSAKSSLERDWPYEGARVEREDLSQVPAVQS